MAEGLRQQQYELSQHLRDPHNNPPPAGLEDRRLAIYRDLFFNNIESLLSGTFPVIVKTLGQPRWLTLVRHFYAHHPSHTPLFAEIGREFVRYLERHVEEENTLPPWIAELAHYEWAELGLQILDDEIPAHDPNGNLMTGIPALSPTAWALAYTWPVQELGPDYQPTQAPETPTLLLVQRDLENNIRFAVISPLVYRLIELLGEAKRSGHDTLHLLAVEAQAPDPIAFVTDGTAMLLRMREESSLLGTLIAARST